MTCARCAHNKPVLGVLCAACGRALGKIRLAPEQVKATTENPVGAALVDMWGRAHALDASTVIGRDLDGPGIAVIESLVSRHHARISRQPSGTWEVRDLGSSNGTFLNGEHVTRARALTDRDEIAIGHVAFLFVADVRSLPPIDVRSAIGETFRPEDGVPALPLEPASTPVGGAPNRLAALHDDTDRLPVVDILLIEPTGGGGGMLELDGKQLQLSPTQFELLSVLCARMRDEQHQPTPVRGFVRTSELIGDLSWDTPHPGDNHVKQLVRRVRRALERAGMGDLVESRHRFGYRLRAIPRDSTPES